LGEWHYLPKIFGECHIPSSTTPLTLVWALKTQVFQPCGIEQHFEKAAAYFTGGLVDSALVVE